MEAGLLLSWTPGSASVLRARPGSVCVGAAKIGIGTGWAEEYYREAGSMQATGVQKGQLLLRGPGRTVKRRFELVVRR